MTPNDGLSGSLMSWRTCSGVPGLLALFGSPRKKKKRALRILRSASRGLSLPFPLSLSASHTPTTTYSTLFSNTSLLSQHVRKSRHRHGRFLRSVSSSSPLPSSLGSLRPLFLLFLITGIGRSTSEALVKAGYRVVLSGRRQAELDISLQLCLDAQPNGKKPEDLLTVAGDVSDQEAVVALFKAAVEKFGRVDVVFNVSPA